MRRINITGFGHFSIIFAVFLLLQHQSYAKICYPVVGCFNVEDWYLLGAWPPQHPSLVSTFMYFYNRNHPNGTIYNIYPSLQVEGMQYDPSKNTMMICHGYIDNSEDAIVLKLKDAILKRLDVNLFIFDYSAGAAGLYPQTLGNLPLVARLFTKVVLKIGVKPSQMHIIGHSLGAHVAGQMGMGVEKETGEKIARITGLDPAGPWIGMASSKFRVDAKDAKFVEIIHTNSVVYGTFKQLGHMDFYINGGGMQPGCSVEKIVSHMDFKTLCAHPRAFEYFSETLDNPNCIKGKPINFLNSLAGMANPTTFGLFAKELSVVQGTCADNKCVSLGMESIKSPLRGKFEVITNNKPPFCIPLL